MIEVEEKDRQIGSYALTCINYKFLARYVLAMLDRYERCAIPWESARDPWETAFVNPPLRYSGLVQSMEYVKGEQLTARECCSILLQNVPYRQTRFTVSHRSATRCWRTKYYLYLRTVNTVYRCPPLSGRFIAKLAKLI